MSHLIAPTAHRIGKTFPWKDNNILNDNEILLTRGVEALLKHYLNRYRLFIIKAILSPTSTNQWELKLLIIPRMKEPPFPPMFNDGYIRELIEFTHDFDNFYYDKSNQVDKYFTSHLQKGFVYQQQKENYVRFKWNNWLRHRMVSNGKFEQYSLVYSSNFWFKNAKKNTFKKIKLLNKKRMLIWKKIRKNLKTKLLSKKRYPQWNARTWKYDKNIIRRIDTAKLATRLSKIFQREISVKLFNIWTYLAKKGLMRFWGLQQHLWDRAYKRFRFHYNYYFDFVNSLFLISLVKGTEPLFLQLVGMVLQYIQERKPIRRFLKFIDTLIKNTYLIRRHFILFRLVITGKLDGGSKRTKLVRLGYGKLPNQTLTLDATGFTISSTHLYGEFGLKLTVCRNIRLQVNTSRKIQVEDLLQKRKQMVSKRWKIHKKKRKMSKWRKFKNLRLQQRSKLNHKLKNVLKASRFSTMSVAQLAYNLKSENSLQKLNDTSNKIYRKSCLEDEQRQWKHTKKFLIAEKKKDITWLHNKILKNGLNQKFIAGINASYPAYKNNDLRLQFLLPRNNWHLNQERFGFDSWFIKHVSTQKRWFFNKKYFIKNKYRNKKKIKH